MVITVSIFACIICKFKFNYVDLLLFRNFPNVAKGANLSIFIVLKTIEVWKQKHGGRLPDEIFLQIDGGAENANKYLLGCLEFLVARGVVRSIYYTRLPVGHTHEDIDACFGLIWNWFKTKSIHDPDEYKRELELAMGDSRIPTNVIDVYALPDYKLFFLPFLDKSLSHLHKEEDAKLQWHFKAVKISNQFPLGVKTMYRSFASDQVVILRQVTKSQAVSNLGRFTGSEPYTVLVRWEPTNDTNFIPTPAGMNLLTKMPKLIEEEYTALPFTEFAADGILNIYSTVTACKLQWGVENGLAIRNSWIKWQTENFPKIDEPAASYAIRCNLTSPMSMLFKSQYVTLRDFDYEIDNDRLHTEGRYTFEWPSNIALSNASVVCSSNLHPPAPFSFMNLSSDGIHDEPINRFILNTKVFYDKVLSTLQLKDLDYILHRKMKSNGDAMPSIGRSKRDKIEILIQWNEIVIRNRFQVLPIASLDYFKNVVSEKDDIGNPIQNISVCLVNGHKLFRSDFKCFLPGQFVPDNVMIVYLNLLQERDNALFQIRHDLNSTKPKPLRARKKSLYVSPVQSITNLSNVVHRLDIIYCRTLHMIYIPIYTNTNASLVVISIESHLISYYDPFMKYDGQKNNIQAIISNELKTVLSPLCQQINGEIHAEWEISVLPKWVDGVMYYSVLSDCNKHDAGIYIMIFLEYLYYDLPLYFNHDDVAYYRKQFCYNIANKCIPNV